MMMMMSVNEVDLSIVTTDFTSCCSPGSHPDGNTFTNIHIHDDDDDTLTLTLTR